MKCCSEDKPGEVAIYNRPYLAVINYRIGRYVSFRRAMLEASNKRLPQWTSHENGDYGVAFIEMWAYLEDILACYQERIANESYLRTAVLRESIIGLTDFIDYRLDPGVGATTFIALIADKGKSGMVPRGFRVASKVAGEPSKTFQTEDAITITSELNMLKHVSERPCRQLKKGAVEAVLDGVNLNLKAGDRILIVDDTRKNSPEREKWEVRWLTEVGEMDNMTTLKWKEEIWENYMEPPENPKIYVFHEIAMPFGSNAPDHNLLTINMTSKQITDTNIMDASDTNLYGLAGTDPNNIYIYLDSVYEKVKLGSYIAAVNPTYVELYRVKKVNEMVKVGFGLSSKVTVVTVDTNENMDKFKLRETMLLCVNELLTHSTKEIDPDRTDAKELKIIGDVNFRPGAYIAISGVDEKDIHRSEVRRVASVPVQQGSGVIIVMLDKELEHRYKKQSVIVYGNVVPASFGEPVKSEILGNGDSSVGNQRFKLRKSNVSFLPDPKASHGAKNSLELFVNDVLWEEKDNFLDSGPADRHYMIEINEKDEMTVIMGNGVEGGRPPTGRDNIIARYRRGVGGDTDAGAITGMVDSSSYLKSVLNPVTASGGALRETEDKAKENGPLLLRTFDRAVSLEDYEHLARSYSGIAKSRAFWKWEGEEQAVLLTVALSKGTKLDRNVKDNIRAFLDLRRDINQKLRIEGYKPVEIEAILEVTVKNTYFRSKVKEEVRRVLGEGRNEDSTYNFFAFERLDFGMSIHLSDIYAAVEGIEGIEHFVISKFKVKDAQGAQIQEHVRIKNTEIAKLINLVIEAKGGIE